jgi:hypothetical protein
MISAWLFSLRRKGGGGRKRWLVGGSREKNVSRETSADTIGPFYVDTSK